VRIKKAIAGVAMLAAVGSAVVLGDAAGRSALPGAAADPVPVATHGSAGELGGRLQASGDTPAQRFGVAIASDGEDAGGALAHTVSAELAHAIGCMEYEPQEHASQVKDQGTCRIGVHRLYIQSLRSASHRATRFAQAGPGAPAGSDVVGTGWAIHVDDAGFVSSVRSSLTAAGKH